MIAIFDASELNIFEVEEKNVYTCNLIFIYPNNPNLLMAVFNENRFLRYWCNIILGIDASKSSKISKRKFKNCAKIRSDPSK